MNILLVYPEIPDTFWTFKSVLMKFLSKKAALPPLGLLTVAAMLPQQWKKKLIDMNVNTLLDEDIEWADLVFISAMSIQKESVKKIIDKCKKLGTKIVAGGPLFSSEREKFEEIDHLVLGEAEITLPFFLEDLGKGCAKHIYSSDERPDVRTTPLPAWYLLDMKNYAMMSVQYSRGCPFDCEFCDIVVLNGHKVRTKSKDQFLAEMEALYNRGWRAGVFVVDDNFIGNKRQLKEEILPAIIKWQKQRNHPFSLSTQASINLADDEELMRLMVMADFDSVFIGIESPHEASLAECNKRQNEKRDLVASVIKIQDHGIHVLGGFIIGFDSDPVSIFKSQINLIQESRIVVAMIGLLIALPGTKLYQRLQKEKRLLGNVSGDNTACTINFIPKMDRDRLVNGYKSVLSAIYSAKEYYERIRTFLRTFRPVQKKKFQFSICHLKALLKSVWFLGVVDKERNYYWKLFFCCLFQKPKLFSMAITYWVYGHYFRTHFGL